MFGLTDQPIDSAALHAKLARADAGACVIFEGRVRNHHGGKPVTLLEYEAFDELARVEGAAIVEEAERAHPGSFVTCVHRTGALSIGEIAVWIGVASAHRHAGFLACRQVIEEIKRQLPVWKKEHHPGEEPQWVNCTVEVLPSRLSPENYYERQVSLPEVGPPGQTALSAADVLVAGLGGLGCPAALYLATSGVGKLTLVDVGKVEVSNLHRQVLFTADDIGAFKVAVGAARLRQHNPLVQVEGLPADVTAANVAALVTGRTAVLDCTDNFATRFLLHDACRMAGVPLISAAVYRFEGELNLFSPATPGCLHCLWSGQDAAALEAANNCSGEPVFAPTVGLMGIMQAAETLKLLLGLTPAANFKQTRLVNLLDGSTCAIERNADPACVVCGPDAVQSASAPHGVDISSVMLTAEEVIARAPLRTVALLEDGEILDAGKAPAAAIGIPVKDLAHLRALARERPTLLACRYGIRSAALARLLRREGIDQVYSLIGGLAAIHPRDSRIAADRGFRRHEILSTHEKNARDPSRNL
ncbi:MAG: thiF [Verrucomicrobia bacterium]|nr:thiF [Verrucomicrobiota bacterium]